MKKFLCLVLSVCVVCGCVWFINHAFPHKVKTRWNLKNHVSIVYYSDGTTEEKPLSGFWYE